MNHELTKVYNELTIQELRAVRKQHIFTLQVINKALQDKINPKQQTTLNKVYSH